MAILPRKNNSLANQVNFRWVIFKLILVVSGWGISCETALIWVSLDHTYEKSTLVQVMAWCRQATSQYLSQCWPRFLSPYGVTRPQWVKDGPMVKVTKAPFSDLSVKDITDFWKSTNQFFYPSALRAGGVLSSRSGRPGGRVGGRAGGCQTCGTHISVTAWWIFSIRSSVELS